MSKKQDKQRKAKHPGKRTSSEGNIFYEYRTNRSDKNRTTRLKKGGILKAIGKDLTKKVSLREIFSGK